MVLFYKHAAADRRVRAFQELDLQTKKVAHPTAKTHIVVGRVRPLAFYSHLLDHSRIGTTSGKAQRLQHNQTPALAGLR
jgi:hypothetical protein